MLENTRPVRHIAEIIVYSFTHPRHYGYTTRTAKLPLAPGTGNAIDHGNQVLIRDFHCIPLRIREVEL